MKNINSYRSIFNAVACMILLCGCFPLHTGPYLLPSSADPGAKVFKSDCCGSTGPSNLMVIEGPKGVRCMVMMRRSMNRIEGKLAIDAPLNVQIELISRQILFEDAGTARLFSVDITGGNLLNHEVKPWGVPTCPNIGLYHDLPADGTATDRFIGAGKFGSRMVMDISVPAAPSGKFSIQIPKILVDGLPFAPAPVEFIDTVGDWEIYPMNC